MEDGYYSIRSMHNTHGHIDIDMAVIIPNTFF